jgi:DNA modification methylase
MSDFDGTKHGFLFACTNKTEKECFERLLFGTERAYGPVVIRIKKGDLLFLNNLSTNVLYGVFRAVSDGKYNIQPDSWSGKYPYQVKVDVLGKPIALENAKIILKKIDMGRYTILSGKKLIELLDCFMPDNLLFNTTQNPNDREPFRIIMAEKDGIRKNKNVGPIFEVPPIEATTFWDFLRQGYGSTNKGNNKYPGVTPALIIYNLIWRYTDPEDLVVDPMCGSGTTIDVCKEEMREVKGYDISPVRSDIIQNDARKIPLENNSVDMIFIDSPYGDNVKYNDHPEDIGKISSETEKFYDELEKVMQECHRILKEGKILGWLIGDQWVKNKFTHVGFKIYDRLCRYFEPVDIICVARRGQSSHTGLWFNRARRFNFYLRGFKYLIIMRKTSEKESRKSRKVEWTNYERVKK